MQARTPGEASPWVRWSVENVIVAVFMFFVASFGLKFAEFSNDQVSAITPGAGIGLALLLWRGLHIWPGLALAGLSSRYLQIHDLLFAASFVTEGTAATVGAAWLLRRLIGPRVDFGDLNQVLRFLLWGAVARAALIATMGLSLLVLFNRNPPDQSAWAWVTMLGATAMGTVVFGPLILSWVQPAPASTGDAGLRETAAIFGLLLAAAWFVFRVDLPLAYMPIPLLAWAGMRLGTRQLTMAITLLVVLATAATVKGDGPFGRDDLDQSQSYLLLQAYAFLTTVTGLIFGAVSMERRRALANAATLTSFQNSVLNGSNFAIIVCDNDGVIRSVNHGTEVLLGYEAAELIGQYPRLWHDPVEVAERTKALAEQLGRPVADREVFEYHPRRGQPHEQEWTFIRKDGSRVPVFLSITALQLESGAFTGFMGVAVDITVRKQAEAQIRAARLAAEQASRTKSEFLANVSHEIRTPMNAILGFAELLQRDLREPAMKKQAKSIVVNGQSLLQLIDDILDLSKVEAGRLEIRPAPLDVRELLEEVRQFFALKAEEKGLRLTVELSNPLTEHFLVDEVRVRQILFNLVGNALKFTEQGRIAIVAEASGESAGLVTLHLEVRDTGLGIAPEQLSVLFTPFQQSTGQNSRKYGGTGLGLSISRRLAELMGGTLVCASEVGVGSAFRLTLPHVQKILEVAPKSGAERPRLRFQSATVLAVDDVPNNLDLLEAYLADTGLKMVRALSGAEALRLVATEKPRMILLDLRMPGMDGREVLRRLRGEPETAALPVIVVTASSLLHEEREIRSSFSGLLRKPVHQSQLLDELSRFLPLAQERSGADDPAPAIAPAAASSPAAWELCAVAAAGPWRETWERLQKLPVSDEVERFGEELAQAAGADTPDFVRAYGEKLAAQARDFEIQAMTQTLREFPALAARLPAAPAGPPAD